jgi:ABC-type Fe3+-hydroxamate transport system substrate-binding protein
MNTKRKFTDQMGRMVEINFPPQRIVSLVPSQTELLYDLGLTDEVVGQTLFCIHPEVYHKTKPRVGGTKNFKYEAIAALKPDLIIGNKEENEQGRIEELANNFPVWMSDIQTLDDSLEMIRQVGVLVDREQKARELALSIQASFDKLEAGSWRLEKDNKPQTTNLKPRTAYFIWRKPWMVAGHDTFISDMLNRVGLENVFASESSRYPEVTERQIGEAAPDIIFLSSEPYPFKQQHIDELQVICPQAKIVLVDGELFSWYGSRLLYSAEYFKGILKQLSKR